MTETKQGHERTIESFERFRMRWETDRELLDYRGKPVRLHSVTFLSRRRTEGPNNKWAAWSEHLTAHGSNVLKSGETGNREIEVRLTGWWPSGKVDAGHPWAQPLLDEAIAIRDSEELGRWTNPETDGA